MLKKILSYRLCVLVAAVAALSSCRGPADAMAVAGKMSDKVQKRMDKLDLLAERISFAPDDAREWPLLDDMGDDMVLYKYVDDTLHSWYNVFPTDLDDIQAKPLTVAIGDKGMGVQSPLAGATETPALVNLGSRWYILKVLLRGNVRIIEGLLVKDSSRENIVVGRSGINRSLRVRSPWISGGYNVSPLAEDGGEAVILDGVPVFKVIYGDTAAETSPWNSSRLFSPTLYAHDGLLNSFAALIIFNTLISIFVWGIYHFRRRLIPPATMAGYKRKAFLGAVLLLLCALIVYSLHTFSSLIINSGITLELYRIQSLSWYSLIVLISYAFLLLGVPMLVEYCALLCNRWYGGSFTVLSMKGILTHALIGGMALSIIGIATGFYKEESRTQMWGNRLAVDRDLTMEIRLRRVESSIASDPGLDVLSHMYGSEALVSRRLDEMYLGYLREDYDVDVAVYNEITPSMRRDMEAILSQGQLIGAQSHFVYDYSTATGSSRYTGIFPFYNARDGLANIVITITPKFSAGAFAGFTTSLSRGVNVPPFYSWAKYNEGRLVSFRGGFGYPTVLSGMLYGSSAERSSFIRKGYRHFVCRVSEAETIILSRRSRSWAMYLVSYSYMVFLLFLTGLLLLRKRSRPDSSLQEGSRHFTTRVRRLVAVSLSVTLVVMATVSVVFVAQRNEGSSEVIMSGKISTIQATLDASCRNFASVSDIMSPQFASTMADVARSASTPIGIFSPGGHLLMGSSRGAVGRLFGEYSRIDPEAYRNLVFNHQRYYITKKRVGRVVFHMMYAPVLNSAGSIVAIAVAPYMDIDYDFTRDAVFHAATIISVFLILFFISMLVAGEITRSIFSPLSAIGERMSRSGSQMLQPIEYDGDDEISALVQAYNTMVSDLRESTSRLAAAERDKAWSQMARQVAHEIKNPLTPIKLEIQRLLRLRSKGDPDWVEKFDGVASVVLEHIDILSQTANEFSTFAKLYTEEPVEIDLDSVLRDQIMLFSSSGVKITYLGMAGASILGPKPQIIRVFVNLLSNAVQAVDGRDGAEVVVSLRRSGGIASTTSRSGGAKAGWDIVFEDNGDGVAQENVGKLFTPNFTTKSSGTGLGLAICRSIVDRCDGNISYSRSFTLGGACFTVFLPKD